MALATINFILWISMIIGCALYLVKTFAYEDLKKKHKIIFLIVFGIDLLLIAFLLYIRTTL